MEERVAKMDKDGDGKVGKEEFRDVLEEMLRKEGEMKDKIDNEDKDGLEKS